MKTQDEEEGIARSAAAANPAWILLAEEVVLHYAAKSVAFTTDDVLNLLEERYPSVKTKNYSALGRIIKQALKTEVIKPLRCDHGYDATVRSRRPKQRRKVLTIYVGHIT